MPLAVLSLTRHVRDECPPKCATEVKLYAIDRVQYDATYDSSSRENELNDSFLMNLDGVACPEHHVIMMVGIDPRSSDCECPWLRSRLQRLHLRGQPFGSNFGGKAGAGQQHGSHRRRVRPDRVAGDGQAADVRRQKRSKIIFIGDVEQLQPISAGPALKILSTILEPARIETIVRQRETWARDAAQAFAKGNAAEGLNMYAERNLICDCAGAKATIETAVNEYRQAQRTSPSSTHLLIAKSNKTVRALNAELRRHMREDGLLSGPDYVLSAGDSSGEDFTCRWP